MRVFLLRVALVSSLAFLPFVWSTTAAAQESSLRAGESMDLHPVYWVRNCQSQLRRIEGIDLLEGPPGITLSIRSEEEVMTGPRQNCQNKVRGGIVVATVKDVPAKVSATLTYRVRYDTDEGPKQSTHTRLVTLYP